MKRVKTLTGNKTYGTTMCKGGCGECQILPVCLQDILYSR